MSTSSKIESKAAIDVDSLRRLKDVVLNWRFKSAPAESTGQTIREYVDAGHRLEDLQTPLLTLDAGALQQNMDRLASWCNDHHVLLAPHGKTTMAPQLWAEQLNRGAWGITLANFAQLQVARAFSVNRLQLANSLTDPRAIKWVADESGADCQIISWIDSVETVELIERTLKASGDAGPLEVVVELGVTGGRTGARGIPAALEVARSVAASDSLRLVGVGGYEGALAHSAGPEGLARVDEYLTDMKTLHNELLTGGLYAKDLEIMLTAGGSAYFDNVVDVLGPCATSAAGDGGAQKINVVIRSGAYVIHDDGFYKQISPFSRNGFDPFHAGMHAWARVVSHPESGLAILDAGKRDLPVDEGLPVPQTISSSLGGPMTSLSDAAITAVNDQHCYLNFDPATTEVHIGDVVRLGLSHPCTALDKWTLIPVLADADNDHTVVDLIHTFF